jgi:hypothetical protein
MLNDGAVTGRNRRGLVLWAVSLVLLLLVFCSNYTGEKPALDYAWVLSEEDPASRTEAAQLKWRVAAAQNLTTFRGDILHSLVKHGFRIPFNRTQWSLFQPIVTCPPGQPLSRYPKAAAAGTGAAPWCRLEGMMDLDCVIYSLGSVGKCQNILFNNSQHCAGYGIPYYTLVYGSYSSVLQPDDHNELTRVNYLDSTGCR